MAGEGFRIKTKVDSSELLAYLREFKSDLLPQVMASSLTATARRCRKFTLARIETRVGLTPSEAKKRLRLKRAQPTEQYAALFLNRKMVVLRETPASVNPYAQARRGKRVTSYRKHKFKNAFVLRVDGRNAVFYRPSSRRMRIAYFPMLPAGEESMKTVVEGYGPSLFQKIASDTLRRALERRGSLRSVSIGDVAAEVE